MLHFFSASPVEKADRMEIDFLVPVARHNLFAALHGTMSVDVWDAPASSGRSALPRPPRRELWYNTQKIWLAALSPR